MSRFVLFMVAWFALDAAVDASLGGREYGPMFYIGLGLVMALSAGLYAIANEIAELRKAGK